MLIASNRTVGATKSLAATLLLMTKLACALQHVVFLISSEPTNDILRSVQWRARSLYFTQLLSADWLARSFEVDVRIEIVRHEAVGFLGVTESCRPVVAVLLGVRLIRVIEIQVRGLRHDHLEIDVKAFYPFASSADGFKLADRINSGNIF